MSLVKYIEKQQFRYNINNKYDIAVTNDIFKKINNLIVHFNDWTPNDKEFDNFVKNHIVPSLKYLGQEKQNEYNEMKKNKINLTNDDIKRYNYLIKMRKYKINNHLDCVELEKSIKMNIIS